MVLTNNVSGKKTTLGRKKIEIKKIEETNSRQVTFSKRRTGLFKKAAELCVLTGAQLGIIVNSPGGRVFAFGHPNADVIIDRYLNNNNENLGPPELPTNEFNQHYAEVSRELEVEKMRREMIPGRSSEGVPWYEESVEGMDVAELEQYLASLEELRKKVVTRAEELMMINNAPPMFGLTGFDMGWKINNNAQYYFDHDPTNGNFVQGGLNFNQGGDGLNFNHQGEELGKF